MKLPDHLTIPSLQYLRDFVGAYQGDNGQPELVMNEKQYNEYKQRVFEADYMRRFDGVMIKISPTEESTKDDGSL